MIFFDCERLKHPNTGLYHYTLNLSEAIRSEAMRRGLDLCFYVPSDIAETLDSNTKIKHVRAIDRLLLYDHRISLWHTTSQLSRYQPLNGKKVLTIHDLNFLYEPLTDAQKKRRLAIVNKNLRGSRAIIAISEYVKQDILRHLDIGDRHVEVIYNGCNHYDGPVNRPAVLPEGEFLFAMGIMAPKKNFHVLPPLLVGNDYKLLIVGNIDSKEYRDKVIEEARRYGVEDRVIVAGPVSEAEKHWCLRNCAAFLQPSIAEGFGLPVIEAMQYGRPVFISDHTSLTEVGGDMAYYFNHEFDPEAMQCEFAEGMADYAAGGKDSEAIRRHAAGFSWDEAARKHLDLYEKVLADRL